MGQASASWRQTSFCCLFSFFVSSSDSLPASESEPSRVLRSPVLELLDELESRFDFFLPFVRFLL
jgi:hypothetical protein